MELLVKGVTGNISVMETGSRLEPGRFVACHKSHGRARRRNCSPAWRPAWWI